MNAIAGIAIGIANDSWIARLLIPLAWALVWCVYCSIFRRPAETEIKTARFNMSPMQAFYLTEYLTAATMALLLSIASGAIRQIIFH